MAIAAGLPAPKVMWIDTPGASGAAISTSPPSKDMLERSASQKS
jgi:hypothetical protein